MTKQAAERYALAAAGTVIVALTAGAFWLSYAHLAEVAGRHGLNASPPRRWAWPATLDAFIVAGELLMLRAGLRQVTDRWAIAATATGSVGSIALNVAGVSGTDSASTVPLLDYVVAAIPPTAALLAFGVLMRQIHQLVDQPTGHPDPTSAQPPVAVSTRPADLPAVAGDRPMASPSRAAQGKPRGGRPASATIEELVEIGRIAVAEQGKLTRAVVSEAIRDKGLTASGARLTEVMNILRSGFQPNTATGPDSS
ncbi:DUF2637 domain-containing protein [Streptomyces melanogenes]|uniref:DUF2637 domain-containing protein n=1 Tax=Streptomyces melanogenes TaxID=67326 RepID=UPI00167DFB9A|nr:DUF2637 domain-containing protein [Streptomyces melanogenes]GGP84603.1 hypothetical protein GCM10010278_73860 [Streptomyces melanogenes]